MPLCYTATPSSGVRRFAGSLLYETDTALFVDFYNLIKTDIASLIPVGDTSWCAYVNYRCLFKSSVVDGYVPPEFQGAIPRYKIGRFTFINSEFAQPVEYLQYVKQQSNINWVIITDDEKVEEIEFELCETVDTTRLFVSPADNYQGVWGNTWNYATDLLLDPDVGWETEVLTLYSGLLTLDLYSFGTTAFLSLNY